jgi:hypothetical protein
VGKKTGRYCPKQAAEAAVEYWRLRLEAKKGGKAAEVFTEERLKLARIVCPWAPNATDYVLDHLGFMNNESSAHRVSHQISFDHDSGCWYFSVTIGGANIAVTLAKQEPTANGGKKKK